jgi:hypothetical protein
MVPIRPAETSFLDQSKKSHWRYIKIKCGSNRFSLSCGLEAPISVLKRGPSLRRTQSRNWDRVFLPKLKQAVKRP